MSRKTWQTYKLCFSLLLGPVSNSVKTFSSKTKRVNLNFIWHYPLVELDCLLSQSLLILFASPQHSVFHVPACRLLSCMVENYFWNSPMTLLPRNQHCCWGNPMALNQCLNGEKWIFPSAQQLICWPFIPLLHYILLCFISFVSSLWINWINPPNKPQWFLSTSSTLLFFRLIWFNLRQRDIVRTNSLWPCHQPGVSYVVAGKPLDPFSKAVKTLSPNFEGKECGQN